MGCQDLDGLLEILDAGTERDLCDARLVKILSQYVETFGNVSLFIFEDVCI
jgi:hypothetical protein